MDCSQSPAETIFFTNSGAGTCQGKFEAVCGPSEVSLTRYEDYSCQGGKEDGYPMSFTNACGYANSLGFSKYGYATCSESTTTSSDVSEDGVGEEEVLEAVTGASVTDLETLLAKEQKKLTEGRGDEAKILGLQKRLAALLQLQPGGSTTTVDSSVVATTTATEVAVEEPITVDAEVVVENVATTESTTTPAEYDHTRTNIKRASPVAPVLPAAAVVAAVEESIPTVSTSEETTMQSSGKAEAKAEKKALKLEEKEAKKEKKSEEKEEKKSEKSSSKKSSSKSKHS